MSKREDIQTYRRFLKEAYQYRTECYRLYESLLTSRPLETVRLEERLQQAVRGYYHMLRAAEAQRFLLETRYGIEDWRIDNIKQRIIDEYSHSTA
ncbi:MAG: hypothetical protein OHK0046_51280 [Anaerolineae bacterium]